MRPIDVAGFVERSRPSEVQLWFCVVLLFDFGEKPPGCHLLNSKLVGTSEVSGVEDGAATCPRCDCCLQHVRVFGILGALPP